MKCAISWMLFSDDCASAHQFWFVSFDFLLFSLVSGKLKRQFETVSGDRFSSIDKRSFQFSSRTNLIEFFGLKYEIVGRQQRKWPDTSQRKCTQLQLARCQPVICSIFCWFRHSFCGWFISNYRDATWMNWPPNYPDPLVIQSLGIYSICWVHRIVSEPLLMCLVCDVRVSCVCVCVCVRLFWHVWMRVLYPQKPKR